MTKSQEGYWIASSKDKIIASGKNIKEVAHQAQTHSGKEKFLIVRIPGEGAELYLQND